MRSTALILPAIVPLAAAFPMLAELEAVWDMSKRAGVFPQETSNCGSVPCLTFNAKDQYVDVSDTGPHRFIAPGPNDQRGLCPGLNAAANHGFLPRNGLPHITDTINGLAAAYNMAPDLSGFLAVVSVALTGDYVTQTWSIGGPFAVNKADGLLSTPGGINNAHNKYEGDASVTRGDAYLNNGDGTILKIDKFQHLYDLSKTYTFPVIREHDEWVWKQSVSTNPYFFSAPFSGLVAPAAYQFIINFMSNHSASNPEGTLTQDILKSFYAISGNDGSFVHHLGQERIPNNWYRRPTSDQHNAVKVFADLLYTASKYPNIISFGGNTGKVNTFTGVDIANLTGGAYNGQTLLQGNNLGCFFFQAFEAALPDELAGLVGDVAPVLNLVKQYTDPIISKLNCPTLTQYNQGLFNKFPGYSYKGAQVN